MSKWKYQRHTKNGARFPWVSKMRSSTNDSPQPFLNWYVQLASIHLWAGTKEIAALCASWHLLLWPASWVSSLGLSPVQRRGRGSPLTVPDTHGGLRPDWRPSEANRGCPCSCPWRPLWWPFVASVTDQRMPGQAGLSIHQHGQGLPHKTGSPWHCTSMLVLRMSQDQCRGLNLKRDAKETWKTLLLEARYILKALYTSSKNKKFTHLEM